ncbi:MAG TPA: glycosyltransferase [Phenylobacterium sp.]|uniref:glycosyltransferase n=1 Tax=Phenylobacterium sp. TaxID=1871053 RepID=UPI002D5C3532|nr:glycosyltransferase [Phenylobacterium sp.]HZZ70577.1 glycosyltransferase [Phenylobacterium sp.]
MADLVFHDPTGRRARRVRFLGGLVASFLALLVAAFFATLAFAPRLPIINLKDPGATSALHVETARKLKGRGQWNRIPHPRSGAAAGGPARPLAVGLYVSWDESSRESLADHIDRLDVVSPQWIELTSADGALNFTSDPQARAIIAAAKHPPSILPQIYNKPTGGAWNGAMASAFLLNPRARAAMIANLVAQAQKRGYAGYVFDLEELTPVAARAYPGFVAQAKAALKPIGREVWVTTPFADDDFPYKQLQDAADAVMLMAYDQHYGGGEPGPVAAQDWFESNLARRMEHLDPAKTVVALDNVGYDWTLPGPHNKAASEAIVFADATQRAHDAEAQVEMDENSLNPTYGYQDDAGLKHVVWFLDAPTLFNQIRVADGFRPLGYALWRMGGEDQLEYQVLRHDYGQGKPDGLENLKPGNGVSFDGSGEVLHVESIPTPGRRSLEIDSDTGLISGENYEVMPSSYVVQRYGFHPGWVAITFDDGPDGRWTPQILDILKKKKAPATFFVIGKNMANKPGLVAREVREGHDVGNHTWTHPDISKVPAAQAAVELSATQRLFETITGRSMRLFRPPYFGDAEPSTPREVAPLLIGQTQGYLAVGLRIDPDDWDHPDASTPARVISVALNRLAHPGDRPGQVILLHDSGGDRSRTVEALPGLIDALRAHGYKLVTIADLAGMTPAEAMPPTSRNSFELLLDRIGFGFFHGVNIALTSLFITAIVLGVGRLLLLGILALVHRFTITRRTPPMPDPATGPLISVLIPCFNEEKVIESSVRRILASNWAKLEVLVLDDGSTDHTADLVRRAFADEPRVTLMSFENGGKARALNRGLAKAHGDVVVALDADTLFPSDTLAKLARWFGDPRVGAVAGNALVGNRRNLITRWQALEYVTAQNLERRALAALGAVTVVPGAVGAWRRAALEALGGYPDDTLAEDQDLTMAMQIAGWRVEFDPEARAYTEAPETVGGLLKQRFRWSFGTLQCIYKHRSALFNPKRPVLGFIALPQIWLFQIILTAVAPLIDLAVVWSLISAIYGFINHSEEWSPDDLVRPLSYWAAFIFLDLSAGALGMALERRAPWGDLVWMPVQRFGYRQLMYYVVVKSIDAALHGARVGWGKLERRASAAFEGAG